MKETKVTCPVCKAPLKVKYNEGAKHIRFKCSECGAPLRVDFSSQQETHEPHTVLVPPQQNSVSDGATQLVGTPSGSTVLASPQQATGKSLKLEYNGNEYPLVEGQNIVGRQASTSKASIQLPTSDRYMSRQHCCIQVSTLPDGSKKAVLSNYKNKNATLINGSAIQDGDQIRLQYGDQIAMGHTTVTFKMS